MAKSKSFFGLRTGSTKSLTFQVYKGQQITKDRVTRISNPRSEAQMRQRAIIPIVAASRAALKGLVDHSFEGVPYGEASLKEFSKQNLRAGALSVTSYSPNGVSNPGFADLIVSNGSINVPFNVTSTDGDSTIKVEAHALPAFKFPKADRGDSADVILKYLESYARTNNMAIIAPGTQLSFLTIFQSGTVTVNSGHETLDAPTSGFNLNRIYIPNGDSDSVNAKAINDQWTVVTAVEQDAHSASLENRNGDTITFIHGLEDDVDSFRINIRIKNSYTQRNNCGMACILSRFENGVWKRSQARLHIGHKPTTPYTYEDWLSTFQTTGAASKKYLNQGKEGTGIA